MSFLLGFGLAAGLAVAFPRAPAYLRRKYDELRSE